MVFNSLRYAVFFPAVFAIYWRLRRRQQNALLLVASWCFYALFDWRFLGLMLLSTCVDYRVGLALGHHDDERRRKQILALSLAVNLGILGFFKYAGFFSDSASHLLHRMGVEGDIPTLKLVLPVGISFYTFHGISYTVDVFRRHIEPARDFLDFAVFVAYFPQLVAGPIGRASVQLPQFQQERTFPGGPSRASGLLLILVGLFKKVAIADGLAPYVAASFAGAKTLGWTSALVGAVGFSLQIYGDFSGYSDIARGSSRLLGIELPMNFTEPYLSRNITEFWRRWHISLSTWLRDYLYVPLGGNRGGRLRTYRNLMITMVLGGLWHGASWTFVVWGTIHGALLAGHRVLTERRARLGRTVEETWSPAAVVSTLLTFAVVTAAFVVFRAASFTQAVDLLKALVTFKSGGGSGYAIAVVGAALAATLALDFVKRALRADRLTLDRVPATLVGVGVGALAVGLVVFSGGTPTPFIYFQF